MGVSQRPELEEALGDILADAFEEEEKIDIQVVQQEIEQIEAELKEVRMKMGIYLQEIGR